MTIFNGHSFKYLIAIMGFYNIIYKKPVCKKCTSLKCTSLSAFIYLSQVLIQSTNSLSIKDI